MSRVMAEYNINKADPLNADHDMTVLALADGEVGFLLNGTWTWPELESMGASKSDDYTIMAYPNGSSSAGKVMAARLPICRFLSPATTETRLRPLFRSL